MQISIIDKTGNTVTLDATQVVVHKDTGEPVAFCIENGPDHLVAGHAGDAAFEESLRSLGIPNSASYQRIAGSDLWRA